ncbi:hypothetical protein AAG747_28740 [Rapidithrix thailandica]|uniref:Uncharacterized protein n=1 Tax=Rapidithrix thailandica TaxID=413964 RepID=A0AAW9SM74_9BACT
MRNKSCIYLTLWILALFATNATYGQQLDPLEDLSAYSYHERGFVDSLDDKLAKKPYVHIKPYYFRAYNSDKEYIAMQLGKRECDQIFLYIKVFVHNSCVRDGEVVEFIFKDGSIKSIKKNHHSVNCDGVIVKRLTNREQKMLLQGKIKSFMVFTFQKDYTFHLTEEMASSIQSDIQLLRNYQF